MCPGNVRPDNILQGSRRHVLEAFKCNESFLLEQCLRFDWDAVRLCSSVLNDVFVQQQSHQTSHQHKDKDILEAAKKQLLATDQWGNTPLHAACYYKPPYCVVTALLLAARNCPDGNLPLLHTMVNAKGATPLVIACSSGVSTRVLYLLLEQVHGGMLANMTDRETNTPFWGLAHHYEMLLTIPKHSKDSLPLREIQHIPANYDDDDHHHHDLQHSTIFDACWNKVDALIQAAWFSDSDDDVELRSQPLRESFLSIVHGAAYVSELFPPILTSLILRCHPDMVSQAPRGGILPLHLAVTADLIRTPLKPNRALRFQRNYFIEQLLEANPLTAKCPIPHNNRLPLLQAIASGLHWHHGSMEAGPLQVLWKASPDALYQRDPVTDLPPFMLAASVHPEDDFTQDIDDAMDEEDEMEEDTEDASQLDTIYSLLRLYPSALSA